MGAWESASRASRAVSARIVVSRSRSTPSTSGRGPICPIGSKRVGSITRNTRKRSLRTRKPGRRLISDRIASYKRAYHEQNREEVIARSKEWVENNLEKAKQFKANNSRKRRAAKHESRGNFTAIEFKELCERYGNRCLSCGSVDVALEADHVVPLTKGG